MTTTSKHEYRTSPSLIRSYRRAIVQVLPTVGRPPPDVPALPSRHRQLLDYSLEADRLDAYAAVCGYERPASVPATFPHIVAFPMHLDLITDRPFPFPAMGLIHVADTITVHEPLVASDHWDVQVIAERLRPHRRGQMFTVVTEVRRSDVLVWTEEADLLARGTGDPSAPDEGLDVPAEPPTGPVSWRLGRDLGRRYARVSDDANPIHLSALTARLFGFRRAIAPGMWELARCLAAVENRLPDRYTVRAEFRRPLPLPGRATFGAAQREGRLDFGLSSGDGATTHLRGRVTPAG